MSKIHLAHNLGPIDRMVRTGLGITLMAQSIKKKHPLSVWMMLTGALLTIPGLIGTDPLLKTFGISTRRSDENYMMNLARQFKPGYGLKPLDAEQAYPLRQLKYNELSQHDALADGLVVG